jgi:hypothetical protein
MLSLAALAAAAVTAAGLVVATRRRGEQVALDAQAEVDTLRTRGLEAAQRERQTLLAEGRRRAETIRADAQAHARQASAGLDAEDQRLAAREAAIERRRGELDERSREIDAQFDGLKQRSGHGPGRVRPGAGVGAAGHRAGGERGPADARRHPVRAARRAHRSGAPLGAEVGSPPRGDRPGQRGAFSARPDRSRVPAVRHRGPHGAPRHHGHAAPAGQDARSPHGRWFRRCCAPSPRRRRSSSWPRRAETTSSCRPRSPTCASGAGSPSSACSRSARSMRAPSLAW